VIVVILGIDLADDHCSVVVSPLTYSSKRTISISFKNMLRVGEELEEEGVGTSPVLSYVKRIK
jgi:hypothetical protein